MRPRERFFFLTLSGTTKKIRAMKTEKFSGAGTKKFLKIWAIFAAFSALIFGCKLPPSPPERAAGTTIGVNYAFFAEKKSKDFTRLSEYFSGEENFGGNAVCRSNPEIRDGTYLILGLEFGAEIPAGSVAELRYFSSETRGEIQQKWELPAFKARPDKEIFLGLTGEDFGKNFRKKITAWRVEIRSPSGEKLLARESFLWLDLSENSDANSSAGTTENSAGSQENSDENFASGTAAN